MFISRQYSAGLIGLLFGVAWVTGCGPEPVVDSVPFRQLPTLAGELLAPENGLQPVRLQFFEDTLFVAYNGMARIDKFTAGSDSAGTLSYAGSIPLIDPEPVAPTSFVLIDSLVVIANHARHLVVIYDRNGEFRQSFGTTPEGQPLSPFALHAYGGVAYVADLHLRQILAISLVEAEDLTELGELILTVPTDSAQRPGMPSAVRVTYDGRLLVGDAATGRVRVYTCDGRYVYDFDSIPAERTPAPQGFDRDNVVDPSMQDSSSWDPSGIRNMGRYHLVDANNSQVHMFNSVGKYVASYPQDSLLYRPAGIAIDRMRQRIFVADPPAGKILIFGYEK